MRLVIVTFLLIAVAAGLAVADEWLETCDTADNIWFSPPATESLITEGGNPGGWWQYSGWFFLAPRSLWQLNDPSYGLVGDWRALGVTEFTIDVQVTTAAGPVDGEPLQLFLYTETDAIEAQVAAVSCATTMPGPGDGWMTMSFPIPTEATELPDGWIFNDPTPGSPPPDYDWNAIIENVGMVGVSFGEWDNWSPNLFQTVGIDNIRLIYDGTVAVESESWSHVKALFD